MNGTASYGPASAVLPTIEKYESGGQNILTQIPAAAGAAPNTASGLYQITNDTWRTGSALAGTGSQYPNAMSAPPDVQTAVATALYNQYGIQPWSGNTALMSALSAGQGVPSGPGGVPIAGSTTGSAPGGIVSSFITPVWELLTRGAVIFIGITILGIALVAMLLKSKTVEVPASALADFK